MTWQIPPNLREFPAPLHLLVAGSAFASESVRTRPFRGQRWANRFWPGKDRINSQPLWGLAEQEYDCFAQTVEVVYHAGSEVNFVKPYAEMQASNVQGEEDIPTVYINSLRGKS